MKKIEYRVGDLLEANIKYVLHGANAKGVFGSGIALAIRNKFPECFLAYSARHNESPLQLGEVITVQCDALTIFNGITQAEYGRDGKVYVDYDAIRRVMLTVNELVDGDLPEVGMPLIGAGLGGGDWQTISKIIEESAETYQPVVYVLSDEILKNIKQ